MSIDSISLVRGALPPIIVGLGLGSLALSLRFKDTTWRRQLAIGIPVTAALVGIAALLVDGLALIPYQFPNSYYLWVGLTLLSFAFLVIGWRHFRNWRRVVSVLSVALTLSMAVTLINQHYQYYPTVGALVGKNAQDQISPEQLAAQAAQAAAAAKANDNEPVVMPKHGYTVQVPIPGTVSGFKARDAFIWVPPSWIANPTKPLPVIELIAGVPGSPADWTRGGFADQTAEKFADAHHGVAPIIVMPDANGSGFADTECVNSPRGQAETYLTVDVPAYMAAHYHADVSKMAIGGLSAGGTCAVVLALRHPTQYTAFGDFAGLTSPTVDEEVAVWDTTQQLFGGSTAAYNAHDPLSLLKPGAYPKLGGWFEAGTADYGPLTAQQTLIPLSQAAGIATCSVEVPGGGHDFSTFAKAFADSLPWMSYRLGLTPMPTDLGQVCASTS
jgi:S-formylglutathione hydrolase FrmB